MKKKILLIGSKGFIVQNLQRKLLKADSFEVFGSDVVQDYNQKNYFVIDATNADFGILFQNTQFDYCINCSGAANVSDSLKNPLRDFHLNTYNVFRILDSIRKLNSSCRFINLSSAAVYGNPESLPISETQTLSPTSPYGIHKLQAEQICSEFHKFYEIETCSLRIFSAYGPGLKKQLFWDVYKKMLASDSIMLWGTGNESRDFIYIDDLVNIIISLIKKPIFYCGVLNVANGIEHTIESVVYTFGQIVGFDTKSINFSGEERKGDPQNWRADTKKLKEILPDFQAENSIQDGLSKYYKWLMTIEKE
jgi:UDP-glucose 4-epimerase